MLTYNRLEYIEKSIRSLYNRAGENFDLYVFDDHSNLKTRKKLKELKKEYKFNLTENKNSIGIYKNLFVNLKHIKKDYEYYVKLDSDIEILTDNFFKELLPCFNHPDVISGITPRVEGIQNSDRYESKIEFYGGHTIKKNAPVVYGCCFLFTKEVFLSLEKPSMEKVSSSSEKWGVDTLLYNHALSLGKFLIVEDVSVYHIDNNYGQRRKNPLYFIDRNRWDKADVNDVWYIEASKYIYPKVIDKSTYIKIKDISINFSDFKKKCKTYLKLKRKSIIEKKIEEDVKLEIEKREDKKNNEMLIYKIISPTNFPSCKYMKHGTYSYYQEIHDWAKNNPKLVIEKLKIKEKDINLYINKEFKT